MADPGSGRSIGTNRTLLAYFSYPGWVRNACMSQCCVVICVGPAHLITLTARGVAAVCLAESGDRAAALEWFEPLLADLVHLPADHGLVSEVRTRYERLRQP